MTAVGIIGNLARDIVAGSAPRVGGTVYYGARAAATLGAPARVVTRCAAADRATLLPPLELFGLPTVWQPSEATTGFSFHYDRDDRVMTVDAVGDPWTPADVTTWVAEALGDAVWIHVGALLRSDFGPATLSALEEGGRKLLVDGQGLVRVARPGPLRCDGEVERSVFRSLAALKLNDEEARILAGGTEPERMRALGVPEVIVTLGSRGSFVVTAETELHVAPMPMDHVRDPTGAGDMYSAAYLVARASGADPLAAVEHAAAFVAEFLAES
jgi:sugar/nucleoside kinase (ribokinase family)